MNLESAVCGGGWFVVVVVSAAAALSSGSIHVHSFCCDDEARFIKDSKTSE